MLFLSMYTFIIILTMRLSAKINIKPTTLCALLLSQTVVADTILLMCQKASVLVASDTAVWYTLVHHVSAYKLKLLCEVDSFTPCIDFVDSKIKYTFTSPVDHGTHTIDHLLVNDGLFNSVLEYYSLHEGTNLSFHSPIILTLHINVEYSSCHTTTKTKMAGIDKS